MLFVVLTFVVGANMEKLICESYQNRKLFQVNEVFVTIKGELEPKPWVSSRAVQRDKQFGFYSKS